MPARPKLLDSERWSSICDAYFASRVVGTASRVNIRCALGSLLKSVGDRPPEDVDEATLQAWIHDQERRGLRPRTIICYRQILLTLLRFAGRVVDATKVRRTLPQRPPRDDPAEGTITAYLRTYLQRRTLSPWSAQALTYSVRSFETFLGRDPLLAEVTETLLNAWIHDLRERRLTPQTIIKHRANLLSLLREAADDGLVPEPRTRKIARPKKPRPQPRAWTLDQLRRLLRVCEQLPGHVNRHAANGPIQKIPAATYFPALVHVAYETGFRRSQVFHLQRSDVADDGTVYVIHEKTGNPHTCRLSSRTAALFFALPGPQPLIWNTNDKTYYQIWQRICQAAGVPHGSLQRVRKTAATAVWVADPNVPQKVQRFLGHLTGEMWRHYVDASHSNEQPPSPPRL